MAGLHKLDPKEWDWFRQHGKLKIAKAIKDNFKLFLTQSRERSHALVKTATQAPMLVFQVRCEVYLNV